MRVRGGHEIDRRTPIRFTFDGRVIEGFQGDTVASALMAAGVRLVGRSFKYHRPRGLVTAGSDEPNALVTTGQGAEQRPNTRATMQEIWPGLEVQSQNRWPSLSIDAMAVNDLVSPFLGAGFYYKTFMWPRSFWEKVYEPAIRRAAGLGALSGDSAADRSERAFAHCDLLVIGAGPTGLMAALTAARAGADVILADENTRPGGRLLSERIEVGDEPGAEWAARAAAELAAMPNVRILSRTTVTGAYDGGTFGALERVALHAAPGAAPPECFWRIAARRAVLAAGALERSIAFPSNDRPGILMAGAARSYLHRWGVTPGKRVAIFGNNSDIYRTAKDLSAAGVEIAFVADTRPGESGKGDWPVFQDARVVATRGRRGLSGIKLDHSGGTAQLRADALLVAGGWNPAVHLTCHMNGRPVWDEAIAAFVPAPGAVPGLIAAGAAAGRFSTAACLADGVRAAGEALEELGYSLRGRPDLPEAEDAPYDITPLWTVKAPGRAWLDLQNDVTTKDVRQAAQENMTSVEHMKRYTTQGMATDQGKGSNVQALAVLADATGRGIAATGTTTFRPPYVPVPIGAMGAGARGEGFAPRRLSPTHAACVARGAPMIEAGLWMRPSYFPRDGERDWRESCDREVGHVRHAAGVADVSTLGKIDVQGPDAGRFLDFVYANGMSGLAPGRVRYGLMLREDGHVMDDGTAARLGDAHFLVSTTTAAAAQVMAHMEFVQQAYLPDLDVAFSSVTDAWAQFAVAGPRARDLLDRVLDRPVSWDGWPFMSCGDVSVGGVPGRLFRISFSGELGYEIAVPARYGGALFEALVARAEDMGGGAYGMEAMNVLRLEKGFLTHAEMHGRVTAFDIGLQGMLSAKKDFIGKGAAARPGLLDATRERLVGLRAVEPEDRIVAGAHLFGETGSEGYVTSAGFSPTLGGFIGLGFLRNGPERYGERLILKDRLRRIEAKVDVVAPGPFDPEGGRMRG
ncbi:sarcosine oxidase subunit alpha family protein [Alphaproteobacteria bacterium GH1-50]|uniref:Sarcosine oxidase subunit alpha family protein n=1 Tax=Kangsaoukella pontilimi TaxID=2691042 RepID=A0A7C9MD40_9RHOB|nr:sarcosine oxidase subunit alpha family protein [Kangsaoukella pontilimi]MXQ07991.1 sarcosine oxidase subunit alpha family protein [Kangsaoukella pontilimi]